MKKFLRHPDKALWTGRIDTGETGNYFHEFVRSREKGNFTIDKPLNGNSIALLGYAVDEGVRRNGGRVGSALGPLHIRRALAKLAVHFPKNIEFFDFGNIVASETDLEGAQESFTDTIIKLKSEGYFTICFGGGHDIAYPHFKAIKNTSNQAQKIGIINLDAHFDLRTPEININSGTPFYQIAQDCINEGSEFNYLCIGIQKSANSKKLFQTAEQLGATYIMAEDLKSPDKKKVDEKLSKFISKCDLVYLSIDMDGFSSYISPGVSAPTPNGFSIDDALHVIEKVVFSGKLTSLDFAETNPTYDLDDRTSKLVAYLTYTFLELWLKG